jgi:hypothetical protein
MVLILDHINGYNNDNRIENLRFVCSNCDSQLDTYKSRNIKFKSSGDPTAQGSSPRLSAIYTETPVVYEKTIER